MRWLSNISCMTRGLVTPGKYALVSLLAVLAVPAPAAVVVLYHHVSDKTPASTSISPARFEAQMDYLAEAGFTVVPLMTLVETLRKGGTLPDKTLAITFDDSYASVYESAYPLLKKRGWPFTFFVNTEAVGSSRLFVSWDQLREMATQGVTIANHTNAHHHLPRKQPGESAREFRQRIEQEISRAQQKIAQEIGEAPMILAYPFGEYDREVQAIAKKLGYVAFGQQSGVLSEHGDLQAVPRFPFGGSFTELDDFKLKVNSLPMPIASTAFYANKQQRLDDLVVKAGDQPWLVLTLEEPRLLKAVNCFATGQGAIPVEIIRDQLWTRAKAPLNAGRARYNCTAPAGGKGRFYWYTQQWLVTDKNGNWSHND
ncbi:polysaccharide deacetylase, putative, pda4D [Cellvibrio japonicus Ueda107]|uniref:Polysaccharide deacetylase, putative, pda4D n=2 Tax=Cellvibrio japonicus TaxID=155077 RepID=B3PDS4_CELJU|nr:polysaccharide deacetylase, putative, pda4D [Cellvibrio japonicus Ueda107]